MQSGERDEFLLYGANLRKMHQRMPLGLILRMIAGLERSGERLLKRRPGRQHVERQPDRPGGRWAEGQLGDVLFLNAHVKSGLALIAADEIQPGVDYAGDGLDAQLGG